MEDITQPREYSKWRTESFDRSVDAAYSFGNHLIKFCRDEVIQNLPKTLSESQKEEIKETINLSLHNVMDLLEGFYPLRSGQEHSLEYILQVVVKDKNEKEIERIDISPKKLDLPIGFWKWAKFGEFR